MGRLQSIGLHTFRWRILLSYIAVSIIPLSVFYAGITMYLQSAFFNEKGDEIRRQAIITAGHIAAANYIYNETRLPLMDAELKQAGEAGNFRVIVTDNMATVIGDSYKVTDVDGNVVQGDIGKVYIVPEVMRAINNKDDVSIAAGGEIISAAARILKDSDIIGFVLIYSSGSDIKDRLSRINYMVAIFTLVLGAGIIVLSFWMSNIIVGPIKGILRAIQRMADGHLEHRIAVKGRNEIAELASSINTMAERLEKVDQTRREFVSNVSHELKTPLSSIKVLSESILFQEEVPEEMYREFLVDIKTEVDRMTEIINDLLELVKLDRTAAPLKLSYVSLNKIIEDILKRLSPLARQREIELIFESLKEVSANVDEVKLSLAITNLIENGVKYTPEGGMVVVTIDADHQHAFIQVRDTGIGMAEEEITKIFDRFYRIDKTRDRETGGTGLGLSITHSVILMHNGSVRVSSSENEGSAFTVRIPLNHQTV